MAQPRGLAAARKLNEENVKIIYKESESGHMNTATLCAVLALVAWYVAVEKPKTDALGKLHYEYMSLKARMDDLEVRVHRSDGESTKAATVRLEQDIVDVQKDLSTRISGLKELHDELQTKQAVDRKLVDEYRQQDVTSVRELKTTFGKLVREITEIKGDFDSASRLEKAVAALEGRPVHPSSQRTDTQQQQQKGQQQPAEPKTQTATGGLVELRQEDFQRMLSEGDTWVVMFYAPWCGHCTAAKPEFQQAALQAPVHFAQIDADKYGDIAMSEGVTGFPTIRMYSQGKQVRAFEGERKAVELLEFAKSFEKS